MMQCTFSRELLPPAVLHVVYTTKDCLNTFTVERETLIDESMKGKIKYAKNKRQKTKEVVKVITYTKKD